MRSVATPWSEISDAGLPSITAFLAAVPAAFEASDEPPATLDDLVATLLAHPLTGKPDEAWWARARDAAGALTSGPALTTALAVAVADCRAFTQRTEAVAAAIVRVAGLVGAPESVPVLSRIVAGLASVRVALAGAWAIAAADQPASVTELLHLERTVRQGLVLVELRAGLDTIAAARGLTREALAERGVDDHGLDADGTRDTPLAVGTGRIVVDARAAKLVYLDAAGTPRKTIPKAVRDADAVTLGALRTEVRAIRKTLAGERTRLDALVGAGRAWPLDDWRAFYAGHAIVGRFTRELIWSFTSPDGGVVTGLPLDAQRVRLADGTDAEIPSGAGVRLWHPILADDAEVTAWRSRCRDDGLVQPVKQAFRETYLLTPAERETATYSNRFAGHVIRQAQTRVLLRRRGWTSTALAWWDDGNDSGVARRTFAEAGVRAELFYDPVIDVEPDGGDLYPLCVTDQVRFRALDGREVPLSDVPPVVLSEALRDTDLVVSVASIGADPTWTDHGVGREHGQYQQYWSEFGDRPLEASAMLRREILAELLPALAIADRCELRERHLFVQGDLRAYEVHLASGGVRTVPALRHVCIVTAPKAPLGSLYLPFDDDPILSLVLSKAFLLASDAAITDPSILAQLDR